LHTFVSMGSLYLWSTQVLQIFVIFCNFNQVGASHEREPKTMMKGAAARTQGSPSGAAARTQGSPSGAQSGAFGSPHIILWHWSVNWALAIRQSRMCAVFCYCLKLRIQNTDLLLHFSDGLLKTKTQTWNLFLTCSQTSEIAFKNFLCSRSTIGFFPFLQAIQ